MTGYFCFNLLLYSFKFLLIPLFIFFSAEFSGKFIKLFTLNDRPLICMMKGILAFLVHSICDQIPSKLMQLYLYILFSVSQKIFSMLTCLTKIKNIRKITPKKNENMVSIFIMGMLAYCS